jgi:hypothetical protein
MFKISKPLVPIQCTVMYFEASKTYSKGYEKAKALLRDLPVFIDYGDSKAWTSTCKCSRYSSSMCSLNHVMSDYAPDLED